MTLGASDVKVGPIAYGCWRMGGSTPAEADAKIRTAIDNGLTLIDTADIYGLGEPCGFGGAEAVLGEVLAASPDLRTHMVLASKGGIDAKRPYDSTRAYLTRALDASLTRLKTDTIDLYQIHRPDMTTPMIELAETLDGFVTSGKVRHIGVSNFTVAQCRALAAHMRVPITTLQPEFSALAQDTLTNGILDYSQEIGTTVLAWSPLAGGALATGQCPDGYDPAKFARIIDVITTIAARENTDRSTVALAFTMAHGAQVIPIIGTQNLSRIKDAATAPSLNFTARDFYDIVEAHNGEPMP